MNLLAPFFLTFQYLECLEKDGSVQSFSKEGPMQGITRRQFLIGASSISLSAFVDVPLLHAAPNGINLTAAPGKVSFFGPDDPSTDIWSYGALPGPVLKVKQGERLNVTLKNDLPDPTTIHWHGIRPPNAMDGVPFLTQEPVAPGKTFSYDFVAEDAGTFWYHPHVNSAEQVGRGLSGALIVEEPNPVAVDRDMVWVIDDWRVTEELSLVEFGNFHDMTHGGRMGNIATINGQATDFFTRLVAKVAC